MGEREEEGRKRERERGTGRDLRGREEEGEI